MTKASEREIREEGLKWPERKDRFRPPFAPDEKRAQALELFKKGVGYTRASRILNMPANTLRDWLDAYRAGKFKTSISPHLYRYTDEAKANAVRMRLSGSSWNEITERTGVPSSTCRRWLEAYVKKPGKRRSPLMDNGA